MDKLREKPHFYKLYSTSPIFQRNRFEVVIRDHEDNLVFKTDVQLNDHNMMITSMEAEIRALLRGLDEAIKLGISHISIYLSRRLDPKNKNIALLMDDLERRRNRFQSSNLVRESLVSRIRRSLHLPKTKEAKEQFCIICLDNVNPDIMFSVDMCGHRFCIICVKQYLEGKLLDRAIPSCPQHGCKTKLSINRCGKLLTPKLSLMWKEMIKEESTPFKERVYCPYQTCSYLMSKSELSMRKYGLRRRKYGLRRCLKCGGSFCIHCKVPWHNTVSCTDYKKLHPNPQNEDAKLISLATSKGWRQCDKCHHMVERASGCSHMTCKCGYAFCYGCGAKWSIFDHWNCNNYSENEDH